MSLLFCATCEKLSEEELEKHAKKASDVKIRFELEIQIKNNKPKQTQHRVNPDAASFRNEFKAMSACLSTTC